MSEAKEQTRLDILRAAMDRFEHYGYQKTCMAEIAGDCHMSPGNLYRYFKNKLDIAEEIMRISHAHIMEKLREIVQDKSRSARERLKTFIISCLHMTHRNAERFETLREPAREVTRRKPLLIQEFLSKHRALMAEILSQGNAAGEFAIKDVVHAAELLQAATVKYRYPQVVTDQPLDELETEAAELIDFFIAGLACRGS